jgi:hypothetical protein
MGQLSPLMEGSLDFNDSIGFTSFVKYRVSFICVWFEFSKLFVQRQRVIASQCISEYPCSIDLLLVTVV